MFHLLSCLILSALTFQAPPSSIIKTTPCESRKPITELPYSIKEPGSYFLTGNLTAKEGQTGITLFASNVSIDLNGFTLSGAGQFNAIGEGLEGLEGISIRNGVLRNWDHGIHLLHSHSVTITDLKISRCTAHGIRGGDHFTIKNCEITECFGSGIFVANSTVENNTVRGCNTGIFVTEGGQIFRNRCIENEGGISLFGVTMGGEVRENTCTGNEGVGIGASLSDGLLIENNIASGNLYGISIFDCATIRVRGNSLSKNYDGIYVAPSTRLSSVENNLAAENSHHGFSIFGTVISVTGNRAILNTGGNYHFSSPSIDAGPIGTAATATSPFANLEQ